jgi:hypothetical protein
MVESRLGQADFRAVRTRLYVLGANGVAARVTMSKRQRAADGVAVYA